MIKASMVIDRDGSIQTYIENTSRHDIHFYLKPQKPKKKIVLCRVIPVGEFILVEGKINISDYYISFENVIKKSHAGDTTNG